jgi:opacity protein-like surface antigen
LQDLQKSIDLNDNRAIYRSRLLLDEDLAARSASLARIYDELGFQQLALVEGWKSVNTDPANYSAHRFLADSYAVLPRHEIARVSELLQSQLLQPNNITPIQPQLGESNLFLISSGGAANLSFNEFNPLFNRDRIALQASGIVGENETWGGEGVVSGIYKKASFSAGYTHFETDGWRKNADQDDDIANAFLQLELSHKTSVQTEYRYRKTEKGDTQLKFFSDDFLPRKREQEETHSIRLGFRHAFSPSSNLIGNFQYSDGDATVKDVPDPFSIPSIPRLDFLIDDDAYSGEISYLHRWTRLNVVTGAGYFNTDSEEIRITEIFFPTPPFPPPPIGPGLVRTTQTIDRSRDHLNAYLYSYIYLPRDVTFTVGGSYDDMEADDPLTKSQDQFNPKFGITWNPVPNTTLRGAVFRTLKRTLITNQTLEPTQVAGFNQFFDEPNATEAWLYGAALDQKFPKNIYGGAEYRHRDLDVPFTETIGGVSTLREVKWDEDLLRAYLFWTPHKWFGFSGEYLYEKFDRDDFFNQGAREVKTHYVPLGINFFHPSGLSASVRGTYIDQQGRFRRQGAPRGTSEFGEDDFWLVDAAINYRLPKRYGFITVGVTNLFDEEFQYFDTDPVNPRIQPDRFFFASVTLAIP